MNTQTQVASRQISAPQVEPDYPPLTRDWCLACGWDEKAANELVAIDARMRGAA